MTIYYWILRTQQRSYNLANTFVTRLCTRCDAAVNVVALLALLPHFLLHRHLLAPQRCCLSLASTLDLLVLFPCSNGRVFSVSPVVAFINCFFSIVFQLLPHPLLHPPCYTHTSYTS